MPEVVQKDMPPIRDLTHAYKRPDGEIIVVVTQTDVAARPLRQQLYRGNISKLQEQQVTRRLDMSGGVELLFAGDASETALVLSQSAAIDVNRPETRSRPFIAYRDPLEAEWLYALPSSQERRLAFERTRKTELLLCASIAEITEIVQKHGDKLDLTAVYMSSPAPLVLR